ncbi:MAG TPA: hypothetical protein VHT05_13170 [Candidatus Elarobacter sp.]|jgi:hypothetical protein|nr:hypothetical protein [Candidatus Elarobacter sp.]
MTSLRRTVLSVLAAWHGLAAFKNLCDLAAAFGIVPAAGRWRSHNFAAMEKLLVPAGLPRPLLGAMLGGVVAAEAAAAVAFARGDRERAFSLAAALFGTFALIDEAMADYELDETHREILVFVLIAYLATAPEAAPKPD